MTLDGVLLVRSVLRAIESTLCLLAPKCWRIEHLKNTQGWDRVWGSLRLSAVGDKGECEVGSVIGREPSERVDLCSSYSFCEQSPTLLTPSDDRGGRAIGDGIGLWSWEVALWTKYMERRLHDVERDQWLF